MIPRPPAPDLDPRILERVRALLAKAESTPFSAEAEAFTAKAHELMARHRLERVLVDAAGPTRGPEGREVVLVDPYVGVKAELLASVALALGCQAVRHRGRPVVTVVGFPSDLDAVEVLFTSLLLQAQSALAEVAHGAAAGAPERSRGFRSSFLRGYARRVAQRLREVAAVVEQTVDRGSGGALVPVLAHRDAAVAEQVRALFPRLGTLRSSGPADARGFRAGVVAAERADLGRERLRAG